ncbi:HAD-IC family P-type ATPase [Georgenia sp. M64]|uniref:HAD-IC family P-type ATPase n=1 Tax=Georgenia sp. M64 TaxID=3120520 RepID=UPI0030E22816
MAELPAGAAAALPGSSRAGTAETRLSATVPAGTVPAGTVPAGTVPADTGLTAAEVAERVRAGQVNRTSERPSRTGAQILRANLLTRFNVLLGALLAVILVVGPLQDALFGIVIVANAAVGIVQELRAKRTLDRLSVLEAPVATVVRDGATTPVGAAEVVLGDAVEVHRGDQLVVDGPLLRAEGLEIDESLLTGEAAPEPRGVGETVLSGSFVVAGSGRYRADRVGENAYAVTLAAEARRFTLVASEIRDALDRVLRVITWVLVPTAVLLVATQLLVEQESLATAVRSSVAGVVGMVPEGLVLLTSVAFAVGVVRLGARGVLVKELPAIEGLARVDVVGIDKTGTLTEPAMSVAAVVAFGDGPAEEALGAVAHADANPNASTLALARAFPAPDGWVVTDEVPFSSARKWSAVTVAGHGTWVLGAPEVLLPPGAPAVAEAERRAGAGQRVLLLARAGELPGTPTTSELPGTPAAGELPGTPAAGELPAGGTVRAGGTDRQPPRALVAVALVALAERVRPDAAATLRYFAAEGVEVKVISGDSPRTASAVAAQLALPGADRPVDARTLGPDLGDAVEGATVLGRVTPQQKRDMVRALRGRGHVVAMTGDGVNDVLALKEADIGVAMGSGAPAARAVAQLVLMDDRFDVLPGVVAEGRRVIANIERVAHLFLTKTVYVAVLALAVGVAQLPFPFFPRHLTVVSTLTIGVPAFFLALAPNLERSRPDFLGRVLRFAVPAGTVAAAATFGGYALVLGAGLGVGAARTTATVVLLGVGLSVLTLLMLPLRRWEVGLVAALAGTFAGLMLVPWTRSFLALTTLPPRAWAVAGSLVLGAGLALVGVHRLAHREPPPAGVPPAGPARQSRARVSGSAEPP